jgi:hypothetical protein
MKNFDSRTYSINDFREWNERGEIELQPKFQRNSVWKESARSFLMDTIIRGKPIPKIFIRQNINPKTRKTVREVVDGQQRLRTIYKYLENGFKINKLHNEEYGNLYYSELPEDVQRSILNYELAVDLLLDAKDEDVLDIFARLNSYSVNLNQQELLHAKYFGEFRQTAYDLALEFLTFWQINEIFTDNQIVRMYEAELTSDLLIAMCEGIHSKKNIPSFYKKYDKSFPGRKLFVDRFRHNMDIIGEIMEGRFPESDFKRFHLFYSLFCSIYHFQYGLPGLKVNKTQIRITDFPKIRIALEEVDNIFDKGDIDRSPEEREFLTAARRATTDAPVRQLRTVYICEKIIDQFN